MGEAEAQTREETRVRVKAEMFRETETSRSTE